MKDLLTIEIVQFRFGINLHLISLLYQELKNLLIKNSHPSTAKSISVVTTITYGKETPPQWTSHPTYPISETYQYTVDVDAKGQIVGGSFISWDRPDFQWKVQLSGVFSGFYSALQQIYQASINSSTSSYYGDTFRLRNIENAPHVQVSKLKNHKQLIGMIGNFSVEAYEGSYSESWSISAPINVKQSTSSKILIRFSHFDTEKSYDKLKIYEGANAEGPLIAVLSGNYENYDVIVPSTNCFVVFHATRDAEEGEYKGFSANFALI